MSEQAYENCYGVINNHIIGKSTVDNRNLALVYDPDSVWGYSVEGHGYCIHGMKFWKANQATGITGSWDATKWTQTKVGDMTGSILSEIGVGRTTGSTRTITLNGSYTAMDYCFLQIQWGSYPGSLVITTPITFTAPKTISFGITDAQGNSASAQYDVAYMFKGH